MKRPTIYLLRHGQTRGNLEKRFQGCRSDTQLTELGREQAALCGRALGLLLPHEGPLPAFVASPVGRARTSMEILRAAMDLPVADYQLDERVREYDFGDWSGMRRKEVRAKFPAAWREREADRWKVPVPGGESYAQMTQRAASWLRTCSTDTVLVSHSAFGRALRGAYLELPPAEIIALRVAEPHTTVIRLHDGQVSHFSATQVAAEAAVSDSNPGAHGPVWTV